MMRTSRLVNDLARGRIQLALIPVAPILLLPFIIVGFVQFVMAAVTHT